MHIFCKENFPTNAIQRSEVNSVLSPIKTSAENLTGYYICSFIALPPSLTNTGSLACHVTIPSPPTHLHSNSNIQDIFRAIHLTSLPLLPRSVKPFKFPFSVRDFPLPNWTQGERLGAGNFGKVSCIRILNWNMPNHYSG